MRNMSGGIFGGIGDAIKRSGRTIDRRHQMRGDVHQIDRNPLRRQPTWRRTIRPRERLLIDRSKVVLLVRSPGGRWNAMEPFGQRALRGVRL